jgi:hypothetical protein
VTGKKTQKRPAEELDELVTKKPRNRTEGYSPDRLLLYKKAQNDRTACSKLRTKLRKTSEYQELSTEEQKAFLDSAVAELMDERNENNISAAATELEIMAANHKADQKAKAAQEKHLRKTLLSIKPKKPNTSQVTQIGNTLVILFTNITL